MGIVWGIVVAENAATVAVLSLAPGSISTTYLCNAQRCQHKYKWCKRYGCFSVKIGILSSSNFRQYFVSLRFIYLGIVWGIIIAENAATVVVLSLALESISTTYLHNAQRCQQKYKWCKRYGCFSVKIGIPSSSHFWQYFVSLRCIYMGIVWGMSSLKTQQWLLYTFLGSGINFSNLFMQYAKVPA
jgi:hypothetical protein